MDKDDLEFIEDNEGKLSKSEIGEILDIDLKTVDESERRILERCDELYDRLLTCTELEQYKCLCAEYAVVSMKAERIRNRDDNAKMRCVEESKYHRTDNKL
jgi:hypothetical protein